MTEQTPIAAIVAQMVELSSAAQRQLRRHLHDHGLPPGKLLITDRDRLQKAPALGIAAARRQQEHHQKAAAKPRPPLVSLRIARHGNASGGKAVIGAPDKDAVKSLPHRMAPLPGQAPEEPIGIVFDGGSRGNPGTGYGSYALRWPDKPQQLVRLQFGPRITNNEAEYATLVAALEAVLTRLAETGAAPETAHLEIAGDSLLVVNQVNGAWKCAEQHLIGLRDRAQSLLACFGTWHLSHHPRAESVRVLGH